MTKFVRKSSEPYTLITPWSPLSELEDFLKTNIFALGARFIRLEFLSVADPTPVTDSDRKFVLAVATSQDLENFVTRRGL